MALWYLDVVTEGDDPRKHKVLTIQYQRISGSEPTGPFQVLAEWEWGEKQIVRAILEKGVLDPTGDFVPVGRRARFDLAFLMEKAERYDLRKWTLDEALAFWRTKPLVDLNPAPVAANGGALSPPSASEGYARIPDLYRAGDFAAILDLVTREKEETLASLRRVRDALLAGRGSP